MSIAILTLEVKIICFSKIKVFTCFVSVFKRDDNYGFFLTFRAL